MYAEQDPRECSVEQADIDLGQIQVEAASTQPFNFEGLSNDKKNQAGTTRFLVGVPSQQRQRNSFEMSWESWCFARFCKRAMYDVWSMWEAQRDGARDGGESSDVLEAHRTKTVLNDLCFEEHLQPKP